MGKSLSGKGENKRTRKRKEVEERQAAYDTLTDKERLAKLDAKLGEGVGAKKERARLAARLGKKK